MTISITGTRFSYAGNNTTTVFSFPRQFFLTTDIKVYLVTNATGAATLLSLGTHYSITGAGSPSGGTITMFTAPTTAQTLVIYRDTPLSQGLDLDNVTALPMSSLEAALDRAMMAIDEVNTKALKGPLATVEEVDYTLPAPEASKFLRANSDATGLIWSTPPGWLNGTVNPSSTDGVAGDYFLNTVTGVYFQKNTDTTWISLGSLMGPPGSAGSATGAREFDTVSALLANSTLGYAASGNNLVTAGQYVWVRKGGFAYTVAASGAADHHVTTAGGVKLYVQPSNGIYDVEAFGADTTGATDAYAAITKAIATTPLGGTLRMNGTFATSATIGINPVRGQVIGNPLFIPYGAFSDYLVEIGKFGGADPMIPDLAIKTSVQRITVDGKLQARGIKLTQVYNSVIYDLAVFRAYGTSIKFRGCMENSIINPLISGGKRRLSSWVGTQTGWNSGTTYNVGDVVFAAYATYNAGTAYVANDIVNYSGAAYRAKQATTGNTPGPESIYWEWVPFEYFKCLVSHSNKNPHSASPIYTTRSGVEADRYWQQVFTEEPALDINHDDHPFPINNLSFFGPWIRHCDNTPLVRVDSNVAGYTVTDINFIGGQVHQILPEYIDAYNAGAYTPTPSGQAMPARGTLLEVGAVINLNILGGNWRCGKNSYCKAVQLGHKNPGKGLQGIGFIGVSFSGDYSPTYLMGDWQIGISSMPSHTGLDFKCADTLFRINGSNSLDIVDPSLALRHKTRLGANYNDGRVVINENANPSITLGRSGEAGTPNIPIISSGLAAYDSRLRGSGGTATSGTGNANIDAATLNVLYAGTSQSFKVQGVASGVNYVTLTGTVTGSPPSVKAEGSDTNLDLLLQGKGSGVVRFGLHGAITTETLTGYITIKDAAGNIRKLAVVS